MENPFAQKGNQTQPSEAEKGSEEEGRKPRLCCLLIADPRFFTARSYLPSATGGLAQHCSEQAERLFLALQ